MGQEQRELFFVYKDFPLQVAERYVFELKSAIESISFYDFLQFDRKEEEQVKLKNQIDGDGFSAQFHGQTLQESNQATNFGQGILEFSSNSETSSSGISGASGIWESDINNYKEFREHENEEELLKLLQEDQKRLALQAAGDLELRRLEAPQNVPVAPNQQQETLPENKKKKAPDFESKAEVQLSKVLNAARLVPELLQLLQKVEYRETILEQQRESRLRALAKFASPVKAEQQSDSDCLILQQPERQDELPPNQLDQSICEEELVAALRDRLAQGSNEGLDLNLLDAVKHLDEEPEEEPSSDPKLLFRFQQQKKQLRELDRTIKKLEIVEELRTKEAKKQLKEQKIAEKERRKLQKQEDKALKKKLKEQEKELVRLEQTSKQQIPENKGKKHKL